MDHDGFARSEPVSHLVWGDTVLTNSYWNRSAETGIRRGGRFNLVQHGWHNWGAATVVILSRLTREWSAGRIERFMRDVPPRRLPFNPRRV